QSFYPNHESFLINFSDLLGMNGARQWFEKGIQYPVLNHPIHPFYGVYFPTRHEHLHLLDDWLKDHNRFQKAVDIGCGCGVLSFILYKHGIRTIHATDINPNAVYSFRQDLRRLNHQMQKNVNVEQASLLGSSRPSPNDLVVFNPPWIPENPQKMMDTAFYFEDRFFDDFFREMDKTCMPGTTIALIFSDFSIAAGIATEHPVEQALQKHQSHFSLLSRIQQPVRQKVSLKKSWIQQVRNKETVELFVIRKD
ncbi:MAG: methyltransferase, partial [Bacteroidales bacterium]